MNILIKIFLLMTAGLFLFPACAKKSKTINTAAELADAIRKNDTSAVSTWLQNGGDPNTIVEGKSLLYIATGPKGGYDMMKLLLDQGADVNQGAGQYTPLMNAASWVSFRGVQLLLDHQADKTLLNERGESALDLIGDCGGCPEEQGIKSSLKE